MSQKRSVCVFCASSNDVDPVYFRGAQELGKGLAERGHTLVYGGGNIGLMGEVATATHKHGGIVVGVIPEALKNRERAYMKADELVVTTGMRERKAEMDARSEMFVVLPGGFGTLEEAIEALTARFLGYHDKPLVFININRFYDPLLELFEHFFSEQFAQPDQRLVYTVVDSVSEFFLRLDEARF